MDEWSLGEGRSRTASECVLFAVCWNALRAVLHHNVAGNGKRDGLKKRADWDDQARD